MTRGFAVREFTARDLPSAARLLAEQSLRHRQSVPELPAEFGTETGCARLLEKLVAAPAASAAVAIRPDGSFAGYLVGAPRSSGPWGANVWVEAGAHAADEPEAARHLWAYLADGWVADGRTEHFVLVPADATELVDAWFRLGFGQSHVHAVHRGPPARAAVPEGVAIRDAGEDDIGILAALDEELDRHQRRSPVFSSAPELTREEAVDDWRETVSDPRFTVLVAETDGRVVAGATGCPVELSDAHSGIARPPGAGLLAFAATQPAHRGRGIGSALAGAVIDALMRDGASCVVTDWRATNLQSSAAWTSMGFEPTFLRLHRHIGY